MRLNCLRLGHKMAGISLAAVLLATTATVTFSVAQAQSFQPAMTEEGVRKKAVITTADAVAYEASRGDGGKPQEFMKLFFLFDGEENGRIPAANDSRASEPNVWLDPATFLEWNSIQMIDFAPQGARPLAKVYDESKCALDFGRDGENLACAELGSEPERAQGGQPYRMLIPVFESAEGAVTAYKGGFVRVTGDQVIQAAPQDPVPEIPEGDDAAGEAGYDLILVIDSTASMQPYFEPTIRAVESFVKYLGGDLGTGEFAVPLRIGLLFYQDRKRQNDCQLDYITKWRVQFSSSVGSEAIAQTLDALAGERATTCQSDEAEEAVYDALNRVLVDTKWNDDTLRVVALIGNGPPHDSSNDQKNPLALDRSVMHTMADEHGVRFLTFRLAAQGESTTAFKDLALERLDPALRGRFASIDVTNPQALTQELSSKLRLDWDDLVSDINVARGLKITKQDLPAKAASLGIQDYALPTILMYLPDDYAGDAEDNFAAGWIPQKVSEKVVVREYLFMEVLSARSLLRFLEALGDRFSVDDASGSEVYVEAVRETIAEQLKLPPEDLFDGGDTIFDMLKKANLLPFDTGLLNISEDDLLTFRSEDYKRLASILIEKSEQMRDFVQSPVNMKLYGQSKYVYVPKDLFP